MYRYDIHMWINTAKIVFIHIPKTGGTTFEHYLIGKYRIPIQTVYGHTHNGHSLQHCSYVELTGLINGPIHTYHIISFIRNPFHRMVSDLFFFRLVEATTPPKQIHKKVVEVLSAPTHLYDQHFVPQSDFITDTNGNIPPNMIIIETPDIDKILPRMFPDFVKSPKMNVNKTNVDYHHFLPEKTKQLIRQHYHKDFNLFFDVKTGNLKKPFDYNKYNLRNLHLLRLLSLRRTR